MDNKQWEKLISMPEEYPQDSALVERAITEINIKKAQPKKNWFAVHWKKVVACVAAVAVCVGVGIPVYNKLSTPPVVYYAATDVEFNDVTDVETFVTEKNADIGYFNFPTAQTKAGTLKEVGDFAVLFQKLAYVGDNGFDRIELNVVLEKNLTLDFYEEYLLLDNSLIVNETRVDYKTNLSTGGFQEIFAKFTYNNATYYLEVVTGSEAETCVNTYVNMLIG